MTSETQPNFGTPTQVASGPNDVNMGTNVSGLINSIDDKSIIYSWHTLGKLRVKVPIIVTECYPLAAIEVGGFTRYPNIFDCKNADGYLWDNKIAGNYATAATAANQVLERETGIYVDKAGSTSFEFVDSEPASSRLLKCAVKESCDMEYRFTFNSCNLDSGTFIFLPLHNRDPSYINRLMSSDNITVPSNQMIQSANTLDISKGRSLDVPMPFIHKQTARDQWIRKKAWSADSQATRLYRTIEYGANFILIAVRNDLSAKDNTAYVTINVDRRFVTFRPSQIVAPLAILTSLRPVSAPAAGVYYKLTYEKPTVYDNTTVSGMFEEDTMRIKGNPKFDDVMLDIQKFLADTSKVTQKEMHLLMLAKRRYLDPYVADLLSVTA